ncbi:Na+/H+ antiporter subunit G [Allohahella sp. A8]|uniref:Na+/H+ antiporter subunit G n=1 Tax=Allohahella sp. A8 TaxID=3141461 RepID=UPI000C0A9C23|nr:Na+/H+ antiporter subunit G [Hahellaceae bacterium]|tara:strand:- start:11908 stop:12255 length:348 start_codon:yes stop_codon:yes gene_type:complete
MSGTLQIIVAVFILIGAVFALIGSVGLIRLPDFFTRLHGPTKATTLGIGAMLIASTIHFTAQSGSLSVHELLITLFLFITAPITAHMLAKTALHHHLDVMKPTQGEDTLKRNRDS